MIKVRQLEKRFGDHVALDAVDFEIAPGEVVGFLGPNGAGKTTTLRILSTYLTPDGGSASVAGFDVVRQPMDARRKLGYLPENPPLYPDHTVREYLAFCAGIRGLRGAARRSKIDRAVERCGLGDVRGRLVGNLSKGFRQRVGLAQALLHEPQVLVLDEPTVGLDPQQIRGIRELILELGRERTVLLSTHLLHEVVLTCSRALLIHRGRIVHRRTIGDADAASELESTFVRMTGDPASRAGEAVAGDAP